jgi:hypothetical protein
MAWETMATAPQDGTHFLAYGTLLVEGRMVPFQCETWFAWTESFAYVPVRDNLYRKDVVKDNTKWLPEQRMFTRTHWMVLPTSPSS